MEVTTLRLPESLHDQLAAEAEERGLSFSEYTRRLLCEDANTPENTRANTDIDALRDRADGLEDCVADLETGAEPAPVSARTPEHTGEADADASDVSRASAEDSGATNGDAGETVAGAVERVAESWQDGENRLAARKRATRAALEQALERDAVGKSEVVGTLRGVPSPEAKRGGVPAEEGPTGTERVRPVQPGRSRLRRLRSRHTTEHDALQWLRRYFRF